MFCERISNATHYGVVPVPRMWCTSIQKVLNLSIACVGIFDKACALLNFLKLLWNYYENPLCISIIFKNHKITFLCSLPAEVALVFTICFHCFTEQYNICWQNHLLSTVGTPSPRLFPSDFEYLPFKTWMWKYFSVQHFPDIWETVTLLEGCQTLPAYHSSNSSFKIKLSSKYFKIRVSTLQKTPENIASPFQR